MKINFYTIFFATLLLYCNKKTSSESAPLENSDLQDSTYLSLLDMMYPTPQTAWEEQENELLEVAIQKNWPVHRDSSGYFYCILEKSEGPNLVWAEPITFDYEASLTDGTVVDSSYKRGTPLSSYVGNLAPGLNQALKHFKKGEQGVVLLPSYLAYGEDGFATIPPNTPLVFQIHILSN